MARKTKEEAAQTRVEILDAALSEFLEKGFSRSTLDSIGARAGYTRGAVYWHFKDKAAIYVALAEEMEKRSEAHLDVDVNSTPASLEALIQFFTGYMIFIEEDERFQQYYRLVYLNTEYAEELAPVLDQFRKQQRETLAWLEYCLHHIQQQGGMAKEVSLKLAALSLYSLSQGIILTWFTDPDAFSLSDEGRQTLLQWVPPNAIK